MLVVIGIMVALLAILLPVANGVRKRGFKARELSDLRQVGIAWNVYANSHNDAMLPGYMQIEVQRQWELKYNYPDGTIMEPAAIGYAVGSPNTTGPWTWRLLQYLDYSHQLIRGYAGEEADSLSLQKNAELIAFEPAFGYNAFYCGGWWQADASMGITPHARYSRDVQTLTGRDAMPVARTIPQVQRPTEMIVFASSTRGPVNTVDTTDAQSNDATNAKTYAGRLRINDEMPGFHVIVPPRLADRPQWSDVAGDPAEVAVLDDRYGVPVGRYTGTVPQLRVDLSVDAELPGTMQDMRKWTIAADSADWSHTDTQVTVPD